MRALHVGLINIKTKEWKSCHHLWKCSIRYQAWCELSKKVISERKREREEKKKEVIFQLRIGSWPRVGGGGGGGDLLLLAHKNQIWSNKWNSLLSEYFAGLSLPHNPSEGL